MNLPTSCQNSSSQTPPPITRLRPTGEDPEPIEQAGVKTHWRCPGCQQNFAIGWGEDAYTTMFRHAASIMEHLHAMRDPTGYQRASGG